MTHSSYRHTRGYVILLALVFSGIFLAVGTAFVGYLNAYSQSGRAAVASAQALAIAEGGFDMAAYYLNQNPSYAGETNTTLGNGTYTIAISNVDSNTRRVTVTGYVPNNVNPVATKTLQANIGLTDTTVSFRYGVQAGQGGFTLNNNSEIVGNVFSSGPVIGTNSNWVRGSVVSSGPTGLVYGIHATGTVYAHSIGLAGQPTIIDKDAYYVTKTNTTVSGTSYPGSPDQGPVELPISDAQIEDWENQATAGGTATCSGGVYNIASGSVTIGPMKIPCDLNVTNNAVVTINGHIWVAGDINIQNSARIKMSPSLGAQNVAIIADNPSNQITSSKVRVSNTASFQNSGATGSFVFLISMNRSAESGGSEEAFSLSNSASALVVYAPHGLVPLSNNVSLKEVTAYKVVLNNSAIVRYDTGLPTAVFDSGPGGSWSFVPGSYAITQ